MSIGEISRQSGLSEPTVRYYEDVGLVGPILRDDRSGHRRYREHDLDDLQVLACLRAMGMGIEEMRTYQANRRRGHAAAGEQRDILRRHAEQVEREIAVRRVHLDYLAAKAELWDARERGDVDGEAAAWEAISEIVPRLEPTLRPA